MANNYMNILVREDGVYLDIKLPLGENHPTKDEIKEYINDFGISKYDEKAVDLICEQNLLVSHTKISEEFELKKQDEVAFVDFHKNNMEVTISFTPPVNNGNTFDKKDILEILSKSGVTHGILEDEIDNIVFDKMYEHNYLVAVGTEKIDGDDGYLKFYFDTSKKTLQPKSLDDGTVDYQNIELFEKIESGEKLVTIVPPTDGFNGMDVKGKILYAKPGKSVSKMPTGKNIALSDDKRHIISEVSGQIEYIDNKINVLPVLEIKKNVDNSTGNIDFIGSVLIHGGVIDGFTVKAKGNIEIKGVVEGAKIICGADLILYKGIMGRGKADINVFGDLTAKFIESSTVNVGGNIRSNSIMHSQVTSDGSVILSGKNGLLVGGKISVSNEIIAVTIGSSMETKTNLVVGTTPSILERYRFLVESLENIKSRIEKNNKVIRVLKEQRHIDEDKKNILAKSLYAKVQLYNDRKEIEEQLKQIIPNIQSGKGKIAASKVIHSGVRLMIGNAGLKVNEKLTSVRLLNRDNKIVKTNYY